MAAMLSDSTTAASFSFQWRGQFVSARLTVGTSDLPTRPAVGLPHPCCAKRACSEATPARVIGPGWSRLFGSLCPWVEIRRSSTVAPWSGCPSPATRARALSWSWALLAERLRTSSAPLRAGLSSQLQATHCPEARPGPAAGARPGDRWWIVWACPRPRQGTGCGSSGFGAQLG